MIAAITLPFFKLSKIRGPDFTGLLTTLSMFLFATFALLKSMDPENEHYPWLCVTFVAMHSFTIQCGFVSIPNLLTNELYSHDVRPLLKSTTRCIQSILLFIFLSVCLNMICQNLCEVE